MPVCQRLIITSPPGPLSPGRGGEMGETTNPNQMKTIFQFLSKYRFSSHPYSSISLFFLICPVAFGQTIIKPGTTMRVNAGSEVIATQHLILESGGSLNNQGTVVLKKDLANGNPAFNSLGTGAIVFSGVANQAITGLNGIQDMTINNTGGLTVSGNTRVNGILTLTSGQVLLGTHDLILGPAASISGAISNPNMVVAEGTGQLQKIFTAPGSFTYPVGDNTGFTEYTPVTLVFNSGTFGAVNYVGVNLVNAQYPGTGVSYLKRSWTITQTGINDFSCNASFKYSPDDVVGEESDIYGVKVTTSPWITYNVLYNMVWELRIHGLSSFGTFTGNLGDGIVPPAIRSIQDKTVSNNGFVMCADATQTMLIAGNGTSYLVQTGGNITHIAGQNIVYYPGTKVEEGGYLHGYISTTFCNPYLQYGPNVTAGTGDQTVPAKPDNDIFKIYPNPTPGKFTLELKDDAAFAEVHVDIFGILGDRVFSKDLLIDRKQEFSLIDRPTGIYIIHVNSGGNSKTEKIIKE